MSAPTVTATAPRVMITALAPQSPGKAHLLVDDSRTIQARGDDEPYAPYSFFVSGGTITIEDEVNDVLGIYRNHKRVDTIAMPDIDCCADLLIEADHYWLLDGGGDGDDGVWEYLREPGAHHLTQLNHYPVRGEQPTWLAREGPSIVVQMFEDGSRVLVAGPGPITPGAKFHMLKHGWTIDDGPIKAQVSIRYDPMSITLLTRTADSSYYWLDDDNPSDSGTASEPGNDGYLYQLSTTGQLLRTFTLKPVGAKSVNRSVLVSDGNVYQMIITNKATKIYRIEPNP